MFDFFRKVSQAGSRLFGHVGNVVRQWGTTATNVARTLDGHKGHLKSFVSDMGSHFGAAGNAGANVVNAGLEHAPNIVRKVGEKLSHLGTALHPNPF